MRGKKNILAYLRCLKNFSVSQPQVHHQREHFLVGDLFAITPVVHYRHKHLRPWCAQIVGLKTGFGTKIKQIHLFCSIDISLFLIIKPNSVWPILTRVLRVVFSSVRKLDTTPRVGLERKGSNQPKLFLSPTALCQNRPAIRSEP